MHRDFWEAGHVIFPLYAFDRNLKCVCGNDDCTAPGKHPTMPNWQALPVWDDEAFGDMDGHGWFTGHYGVRCDRLLVIDVDARNGGVESYERFKEKFPSVDDAGMDIETGSGGGSRHVYFLSPEGVSLVQSHEDYPGIDFKSSGFVVGPGSRHISGSVYSGDGLPADITALPVEIAEFLARPEYHRAAYNGSYVDVSHRDIGDMMAHIDPNAMDYEEWVAMGMAIHDATQGTGYDIWLGWSEQSAKHNEKMMQTRWHSFGKNARPHTIGLIKFKAQQGGWLEPVTFESDVVFDDPAPKDGLPFDITGVDLAVPPGFTGELAKWIAANSMRPRRHLAVAGALMAIANMGGLRYTDDNGLTTTNLFCFCVAGSGTGKENVFTCVLEAMEKAGMAEAFYGDIKSSKEIIENFIQHQAAVYCIDEVADSFDKWEGNGKNTPSYLSDVMSVLMSAYSKSKGMLVLKGDRKRELQSSISKELKQVTDAIAANEATAYQQARLPSLERLLDKAKLGVEKPFVSIIGFTTPVKFDKLVTFDNATSGFIGRSLIFNERETAPRMKENFKPTPMPETMANTLLQIAQGGTYDMFATRVEYYEDRTPIPSTPEAIEMLAKARRWYDDRAEDHKSITGLEPLWMRALELLGKVSLTLAIPEALRTAEHVRWAFALVRRDIEEKLRLVVGNENEKRDPAKAMAARIMNVCAEAEGQGVIVNRLSRTYRKEDILRQIAAMVERKHLIMEERKHARTGKVYLFYTAVT